MVCLEKISLHFCIIVPTFNRAHLIRQTITSILLNKDSVSDYYLSLIIVDDGSTDDTEKCLQDYIQTNQIIYIRIKNSERGFARNHGLRYAKQNISADYFLFFDADDLMPKETLKVVAKWIRLNSSYKVFTSQFQILTSNDRLTDIRPNIIKSEEIFSTSVYKNSVVPLGCTYIHKDVFEKISLFNEDRRLSGSEDWFFLFQLIRKFEILQIPKVTAYYRQHEHNTNLARYTESLKYCLELIKGKNNFDLDEKETNALTKQFRYNEIGVHNCSQGGTPLLKWVQMIKNFPEEVLNMKIYRYLFSIFYRKLLKTKHYLS